jgi:hypothetical protein
VTQQAQRGNVTLITALTALLMVMVVLLASGLGNTASEATRMQAASDDAAVAAATTYIAVTNDETIFDLIDWALGFIQRLADMVEAIGGVLSAVVIIPPVAAIGAALEAIGQAVSSVASSVQDAFDTFKNAIQPILDEAKSILAIINATILAANNGYLGFVLPKGILQAAGRSKYTLKDIEAIRDQYKKLANDDSLVTEIEHEALETVWQSGLDPNAAEARQGHGTGITPNPARDVFHIWSDNTPGCLGASPAWSRPCKETDWVRGLAEKPYQDALKGVADLVKTINFDGTSGPDLLIDPASDAPAAKADLQDATNTLNSALTTKIDGAFMGGLSHWDNTGVDGDIGGSCPGGTEHSGPYTNFHCGGTVNYFDNIANHNCNGPGPDPKNPLAQCERYWDWNILDASHSFRSTSFPADYVNVQDYRNTQHFKDFIGNRTALAQWKHDLNALGPSVHPADTPSDAEEAFIMVDRVQPSQMSILAHKLSGQGAPSATWTITASIAKIYKPATLLPGHEEIDTVQVNDLCINLFNPNAGEVAAGGQFDPLLGVIPWDGYTWCHVILGFFDLFISFYDAIHNFFYDNIINPIENEPKIPTPFGDICLFCWVGDLIAAAIDALLGPPHPDNRTFHVDLVPVNCVPAVAVVADVANGTKSLLDVVTEIEGQALGTGPGISDSGSCNTGSDPSGDTSGPGASSGGPGP